MERVCRARLLVGVHGSGMEWGHFLNGGQAKTAGGVALAGTVELHYPGWPCYYTGMMERVGLATDCQLHSRAGHTHAAKDDDVRVNVQQLLSGTRQVLDKISALDKGGARPGAKATSTRISPTGAGRLQAKQSVPAQQNAPHRDRFDGPAGPAMGKLLRMKSKSRENAGG